MMQTQNDCDKDVFNNELGIVVKVDIDGDLDLVAPGKSGLYLFENLRVR